VENFFLLPRKVLPTNGFRLSVHFYTRLPATLVQHLAGVLDQASEVLRGKLSLEGDLWPEVDEDESEEVIMDQKERDRLVMLMHVIEDAGVVREAREDALRRLEHHFPGDVDRIDARSYLDTTLRRQAPHLWPQAQPPRAVGMPPAPLRAGVDKPRRPQPIQLTAAQQEEADKLSPTARLTYVRELQAQQEAGR